jgi:hypothetical protein
VARTLDLSAAVLRASGVPMLVLAGLFLLRATTDRPTSSILLGLLGVGIVAWLISSVTADALNGLAAHLRLQGAQVRATIRLAAALDRAPAAPAAVADAVTDLRARHLAEIHQAIRAGAWDDAAELLRAFAVAHPDDPETARAGVELAGAKRTGGQALLTRIQAAREANDPERVIELRDEAAGLLEAEASRSLDRDLARWFLALIQRRLRSGTVRADVAVLAGRVARSLDATPEGASLRASLPTLRRAAGLCPRCAQPYTGLAEACPACLSGQTTPPGSPAD